MRSQWAGFLAGGQEGRKEVPGRGFRRISTGGEKTGG